LKKEMKGAEPELTNNNFKLEMNELIESDPENYQPDNEDPSRNWRRSNDLFSDTSDLFTREASL